ncbi:hypothetical protein ARHIZOSPH14_11090 [Agromyces rhizosphaerae]|uniref:Lipoprotein n=1 Tax=Agromyces rhizosphaerae TaxID=88374 RepID=A0A9W6FQQ3_9MICO|nr:hypothetical protein [Agromyces rhizosphaerae]GLI26867.1 hypothetical protein ARHIZOSPH14_11090 [Agromyces rhizosphaerae]
MRNPSPLLPAFAAVALLLAGCSGGGADATDDDVSATVDGSGATATADAGDGDADASGDDTGTGGDCLVGDWVLAVSDMQAYYDVVGSASGMEMTLDGTTGLSLTADTFEYTPDMMLTLDFEGTSAVAVLGGSLSGEYTTADGVITTTSEVFDFEAEVTVDGTPVGDSSMANELLAGSPVSDAPYDCSGATPVIMFDTGVGERVPVTLQPAG